MMPECEYYAGKTSTAALAQIWTTHVCLSRSDMWSDVWGSVSGNMETFLEIYKKKVTKHFFFFFSCQSAFNTVFLSSLKEAEKPFSERLHRVRDLMDRSKVSIEEVISELGQYFFFFFLTLLTFPSVACMQHQYFYMYSIFIINIQFPVFASR